MVEVFSMDGGMLTIEKQEADPYAVSMLSVEESEPVNLNAQPMIETAFAYQLPEYAVLESSGTGVCEICGVITDNPRKHVCPYCWRNHQTEIMSSLKLAIGQKVIQIG